MNKPRLLDLFCGAGGAAMGYHRAGFDVVGVDHLPQPRYPFEFHQADALTFPLDGFGAIHASPPCQAYSVLRHLPWLRDRDYWKSVPPTLAVLRASGLPWILENVKGAPVDGITLCGTMFGLRLPDGEPLYRHRLFASSWFMLAPGHPRHYETIRPGRMLGDRARASSGNGNLGRWRQNAGHMTKPDERSAAHAFGIDWMDRAGLSQAIPPAYTEWIGQRLLAAIGERAA